MGQQKHVFVGLLCLTGFFCITYIRPRFVTISTIARVPRPAKLRKGTVMTRQTAIISTPTFDIRRHKHIVWRNKDMSQYILGNRPIAFKNNTTTDKLVQAVRPQKFEFIINNKTLCRSSERLEILVAIYTAPKHFDERDAIRKTWGRKNLLSR